MVQVPDRCAVFRVDASVTMGAGHVMRCLTLADRLRAGGLAPWFFTRRGSGSTVKLIQGRGFRVTELECAGGGWESDAAEVMAGLAAHAPVEWLIVDHYGLDVRWESRLRRVARRILVIDDLANRAHDCDVLLDQNYYVAASRRYAGLVPAGCQLFLGPAYALLRDEFWWAAREPRQRSGIVERLLVSFGATDPTNETGKVLDALLGVQIASVDVVVGGSNPRREQIAALCARSSHVRCHIQTSRMAELMREADLAAGAGGATTWERCLLGLPALTVVTADNQLATTQDLSSAGVIWYLGRAETLTPADYRTALADAMENPQRLCEMSRRAQTLMASASCALASGHHPLVDAVLGVAHSF